MTVGVGFTLHWLGATALHEVSYSEINARSGGSTMTANEGHTNIRPTVPSWLVSWQMIIRGTIFPYRNGHILYRARSTSSIKARVVTTSVIGAGFRIVVVGAATSSTPNGGASMTTSGKNAEPVAAPSFPGSKVAPKRSEA